MFPGPRTRGQQLPPGRTREAVSDHPESLDVCPCFLPADKVKKNRQLRKPRRRRGWREGSPLTVFSKKKKKHILLLFLQNLVTSIMTAQCGEFRH